MQYNTKKSQGTFELVGTTDVLTEALSRPEHPGRIHGQSKFIKQSQYFNLNRSSNRDNEVLSMRHIIEELKALVCGLCAKKDVEPSLTKRMCQPLTNIIALRLVALSKKNNMELLVAFGRAWLESLPTDTVHGIPLGEGNVRVSINVPKLKKAALPIPTYEATTLEEAVNGFLACPKTLVRARHEYEQEKLCAINGQAEKFVFVSPTLISPVRINTPDADLREQVDTLVAFLRDAPKG
ncbi:hypothetical protein TIFTF001_047534 [Ficus carica]|uniref:DUF8039 domain-containing protein n=1 Tax=Ficus carica TaxID=3494 RepID=A0AA87Z142_FICCA|nr:hypothetical protein TIFTF001_047528 [Ficus carica]GMN23105.1 hypothetical protein TIFTF001_047530 [Ficus carica]GMN23124.1 hypothetical protein TIFTF001_047532 [Ficus carica]GMN23147.1 hypothetical protein TIFTF001_047534 [Ficus carica]